MRTPADHIAFARKTLAFARFVLSDEYADKAGREAYLAALHAALAFIVARTGREPKTHSGARSEFGRLALDESRIRRDQVVFLGGAYELKTAADYGTDQPVSLEAAKLAIAKATELVEAIAALLPAEDI